MRLVASASGHRVDFGKGLLILGQIGLIMTAIFLGLDFLKAAPLSIVELSLLGLSSAAILVGSLLVETPEGLVLYIAFSVMPASTFLATTILSAWWENTGLFASHRVAALFGLSAIGLFASAGVIIFTRRAARRRAAT